MIRPPEAHTTYQELEPDGALAGYVANYWRVTVAASYPAGAPHVIWPDGCVSVVVVPGRQRGVRLVGPRIDALRVPLFPGNVFWGVRFRPEAGAGVCGVPGARIHGYAGRAEEFLGPSVDELTLAVQAETTETTRALDGWVAARVRRPAIDDVVRSTVDTLVASHGAAPMTAHAANLGIGVRQLQRRFRNAVGLSPKQFGRIRRMREALALLLDAPRERWSLIAAELGYADHSHLVRDIAKLTGLTPTEVAGRMGRITHTGVRP